MAKKKQQTATAHIKLDLLIEVSLGEVADVLDAAERASKLTIQDALKAVPHNVGDIVDGDSRVEGVWLQNS